MRDVGLAGFAFGHGRTPDLDKGLVFLYQQDLIITGNFWNLIVNLDLKWYRTQLDMIDLILKQVGTYQTNPRFIYTGRYINWQEVTYLQAVWEQLNLEFQDRKIVTCDPPKERSPRFWGRSIKFSFRDSNQC